MERGSTETRELIKKTIQPCYKKELNAMTTWGKPWSFVRLLDFLFSGCLNNDGKVERETVSTDLLREENTQQ